jgi:hypothetical protein
MRDDLRSGTRCEGIPNGKWAVKGRVQRRAIRMRWFLMDKRSARCLGLEGGHSRRESEMPKRPLKMPPTSWYSATSPPSLMVRLFFWRYVCSYLAISMAQSIIKDRLLFLPFILKGLQKITPSFLKGCKILWKECEGLDPKIRVIALQFYSLVWRVERSNSWFLAIWLVEIDGLSTVGRSVKRPSLSSVTLDIHPPQEVIPRVVVMMKML